MFHPAHIAIDRSELRRRLADLWERTGFAPITKLLDQRAPNGDPLAEDQSFSDWLSTVLMDCFKQSGDPAVFALLYDLNKASFAHAIQSQLRRAFHPVDAQDVLQEVFLNIYRYPHRFLADKADAFRGWGHRIVRNTLLKFLKGQARLARFRDIDDEAVQPEDLRTRRPDRAASEAESAGAVNQAFLLYLQLYLHHFGKLSPRERLALTLVEVDGASYRDAAEALGIRLENLKMVIFRGRRKIFRGMERTLAEFAQANEAAPAHGPANRRTMEPTGRDQRPSGDQREAVV